MKITKDVICMVIGYLVTNKAREIRVASRKEIEENIEELYNGRRLKVVTIFYPKTWFGPYVVAYQIYQSIRLSSIHCQIVDLACQIMKKGLYLDLAKILLKKFEENMKTIRVSKKKTCKYGSLLVCMFLIDKDPLY